jgi:biotin operon repressor
MSALETIIGGMSLADLARLANKSVEQVVAAVLGGDASPSNSRRGPGRPRGATSTTTSSKSGGAPKGKLPRGAISNESVLAILKAAKGPVRAEEVRAQLGGSGAQVRIALQRLRDAGKLKVTGQRRGTRYALK